MDRSGRSLSIFFLTALFRASGLAVLALAALAALPRLGVSGLPVDSILLAALAGLGGVSLVARGLVRRHRIDAHGPAMAALLLVLAALLVACIQRTGGLFSPLVVLLGVLAAAGGLKLTPLANFFTLSGICLLFTLMVVATAQGSLPEAGLPPGAADAPANAPVTLLLIELGLVGLAGFVVNALACHLRDQQLELACRELRDPETGALRRTFFHARLVGLIEGLRGGGAGVSLVLFDLGRVDESLLQETGALLHDSIRGDDLAGRVGPARFAVAIVAASPEAGPRVARRIAESLRRLGPVEIHAGLAQIEPGGFGEDAVENARRLMADAAEKLDAERVGFAA